MSMWRRQRATILLAVTVGASGCGPTPEKSYAVSGLVRMENSPVELGIVRFVPPESDDGPPRSPIAVPIRNGRYEIMAGGGLHTGPYRVEVEVQMKTGRKTYGLNAVGRMDEIDEVKVVSSHDYAGSKSPLTFMAGPRQSKRFDIEIPPPSGMPKP